MTDFRSPDIVVNVNGRPIQIMSGANLIGVLASVDVRFDRAGIAIAVNDEVVHRPSWDNCVLKAGDRVDIIEASQGG